MTFRKLVWLNVAFCASLHWSVSPSLAQRNAHGGGNGGGGHPSGSAHIDAGAARTSGSISAHVDEAAVLFASVLGQNVLIAAVTGLSRVDSDHQWNGLTGCRR